MVNPLSVPAPFDVKIKRDTLVPGVVLESTFKILATTLLLFLALLIESRNATNVSVDPFDTVTENFGAPAPSLNVMIPSLTTSVSLNSTVEIDFCGAASVLTFTVCDSVEAPVKIETFKILSSLDATR